MKWEVLLSGDFWGHFIPGGFYPPNRFFAGILSSHYKGITF